jgi:hypothetical protein
MPQVGTLCFGMGQLVVAMNQAKWAQFRPMETWSRRARQASMNAVYVTNVQQYSTRLKNRGGFPLPPPPAVPLAHRLVHQWDNPAAPISRDASVMAAWDAINAALAAPIVPGPTFTRPNATEVLPFRCQAVGVVAVARCRRCRVIFRYNMSNGPPPTPVEPQSYNAGPYENSLTCAEVLAYEKCRWSGL